MHKIFYHHIIYEICKHILARKTKEDKIIYFDKTKLPNLEISQYCNEEDLLKFLTNFIQKIKTMLPIKIFMSDVSFDYLLYLLAKHIGDGKEEIYRIISMTNKFKVENFTFSKIKTFVKNNDLTFLSNKYFTILKSKQLVLS